MTATQQSPIAVVGMACRLPGARDTDEFWRLLLAGGSAIGPVPPDRLDRGLYYDPRKGVAGKTYADVAALVDYTQDLTPDGMFSAREIASYDAAHVAFCRVAAEALADAGLPGGPAGRTGVYVGHATGSGVAGRYSYRLHCVQAIDLLRRVDGFAALPAETQQRVVDSTVERLRSSLPQRTAANNPRLEPNLAARLVAEKFGLDGPAMVFNSACASSLQALAHGVKALSLGRIDTAVVGGASCFNSDTLVLFSAAQSLSAVGSHPFTEGADGLVVGEGYVAFVLKTLHAAEAAGDRVLAVLTGVGVSSDGRGRSLWAPRGEGQIEAIRRALPDSRSIAELQYVEAHATSTNLGDKTELESLSRVLGDCLPAGVKVPVGGVKRNVGHTLEVAGAAGLLKTILAMHHRTVPPAYDGTRPLTGEVDWQAMPLYVNDTPIAWPTRNADGPLRAAVNAFGIGGLNVCVALESHHPRSQPAAAPQPAKPVPIAIIGAGAVLPGANDCPSARALLQSGRSACGPYDGGPNHRGKWRPGLFDNPALAAESSVPLPAAARVAGWEYDWRKHKIPPKQLAQASPLQFMMLDAVDQALEQAGVAGCDGFDRRRVGVLVGTEFGGDFATQLLMGLRRPLAARAIREELAAAGLGDALAEELVQAWGAALLDYFPALVDESGSFTASALASRITKSFDLMGGGVAIDASTHGAFAALEAAVDTLSTGDCDTILCVAGEQGLVPERYQITALNGGLAPSADRARPHAPHAAGIVPGEGCVALVLKRLDDARSAGDRVLGIVESVGAARSATRGAAVRAAAERSLRAIEASAAPAAIESVGAGVEARDAEESEALRDAIGSQLPIVSATGQFGYLGSGSGLVSVLAALFALEDQSLPEGDGSIDRRQLSTTDPSGRLRMLVSGATTENACYTVVLQRGTPVTPQTPPATAQPTQTWETESLPSGAVLFDATIRRREKMRAASAGTPPTAQPVAPEPPAAPPAPPAPAHSPTPPQQPAPTATDAPSGAGLSGEEIETFLINFVVEQTGYPPEIVDLDADLEADLGIDSIKKAQLFGELGEYFDVQASADLSLDDFPSLRTVRDYLLANANGAAPATNSPAPTSQPAAPPAPAPAPTSSTAPASPPASAQQQSAPPTSDQPSGGGLSGEEIETFLINFVVEQTGYPPEIVDLDADLEADLGIDSIKKAQLFGELGEYFDVQASADLSLDDFPSLRTVRDYLLANATGATPDTNSAASPQPPAPAPVPAPGAPAARGGSSEAAVIEFVMHQTGYPREVIDLDGDFDIDLGLDERKVSDMLDELGRRYGAPGLASQRFANLREVVERLDAAQPAGSTA
ncbi:beta-ketoacyl synthase N-terminal-like domain-containing protein [Botrimarina sp.]|uniref:beta-ketoacyl synthase N-terminal-like domain-containing protein n=1 Tax=Botrimarina sp. TaxID=2795802 RepID=UPI0032ED1147